MSCNLHINLHSITDININNTNIYCKLSIVNEATNSRLVDNSNNTSVQLRSQSKYPDLLTSSIHYNENFVVACTRNDYLCIYVCTDVYYIGKLYTPVSNINDNVLKYYNIYTFDNVKLDIKIVLNLSIKYENIKYSSFNITPFSYLYNTEYERMNYKNKIKCILRKGLNLVYSRHIFKNNNNIDLPINVRTSSLVTNGSSKLMLNIPDNDIITSITAKKSPYHRRTSNSSLKSPTSSLSRLSSFSIQMVPPEKDNDVYTLLPSVIYTDPGNELQIHNLDTSNEVNYSLSSSLLPFVDYFCVVGDSNPNFNVCNINNELCCDYECASPSILSGYISKSVTNVIPETVPIFCMPNGIHHLSISNSSSAKIPFFHQLHAPIIFSFCLSDTASGLYGTSILFWNLSESNSVKHASLTSMCLLSRKPAIEIHRYILKSLLDSFKSEISNVFKLSLPFATQYLRLISYLCNEIRFPHSELYSLSFEWLVDNKTESIKLTSSSELTSFSLTPLEFSISDLLKAIEINTFLKLLACVFCEQKILIRSNSLMTLMHINECLTNLLAPFSWPHVRIPVLPGKLINLLDAPVPFLIGIHSSLWPLVVENHVDLNEVVLFDLDDNSIDYGGKDISTLPSFPSHLVVELRFNILKILHSKWVNRDFYASIESKNISNEEDIQLKLRLLILEFLSTRLLANYRDFLFFALQEDIKDNTQDLIANSNTPHIAVTTSTPYFDAAGFLADKPESKFYSKFFETQLFVSFLEYHQEFPALLNDLYFYTIENIGGGIKPKLLNFSISAPAISSTEFRVFRFPSLSFFKSLGKASTKFEILQEILNSGSIDYPEFTFKRYPEPNNITYTIPLIHTNSSEYREESKINTFLDDPLRSKLFLESKSQIELNKSKNVNRLYSFVRFILTPTNVICKIQFAELSSLGNLLNLPEWRSRFFEYLHEFAAEKPPAVLPIEYFNSLSFLISVSIDECQLDGNYQLAYKLLDISDRFKCFKDINNNINETIKDILKIKRLFAQVSFWLDAVNVELKKWKASLMDHSLAVKVEKNELLKIDIKKAYESPLDEKPSSQMIYGIITTLIVMMNSISLPSDTIMLVVINLCTIYEIGDILTEQLVAIASEPSKEPRSEMMDSTPLTNLRSPSEMASKKPQTRRSSSIFTPVGYFSYNNN